MTSFIRYKEWSNGASFDSEACKWLNRMHPQILIEPYNVHVRLYTNGFNPFKLFTPYSC